MESTVELNFSSRRWEVLQPPIYLISLLPGLVWSVLLPSEFSRTLLSLTVLAVILIQHGVNVLNDSIDWKKGADSQKELSWVHFHHLNLRDVNIHGFSSFIIGVILGVAITLHCHASNLLIVAIPLVILGYGYNASQWTLSYTSLGEWVTGLCYGPGVFGCMGYLFLGKLTLPLILGSFAFGFLAVAVLFAHQPPQIFNDFLAGKSSFAVRHGAKKTFFVSQLLTAISIVLLITVFSIELLNISSLCSMIVLGALIIYKLLRKNPSPQNILSSALVLTLTALILNFWEKFL